MAWHIDVNGVDTKIEELVKEVKWLRYFYDEARHAMGPADSDVYSYIKDSYVKGGDVLPEGYKDEE